MARYVIKRLLLIIPTVLGVLLIIFTINFFTPGDPARAALGSNFTEEAYQLQREKMGLDQPFVIRYVKYVAGIVTRFDLGTSYDTLRPVSAMIGERIGITLSLGLLASAVTILIGVSAGIISAVKQYSPIDYAATTFAVIFSAAPAFWVALMAIIVVCLRLGLVSAAYTPGNWSTIILPVVCMSLSPIALVTRMTRTSMLDVINQDYIRTARAKGVEERTVIFSHALKNALIPIITIIGAQLSFMVGGSFVIESIFTIPGVGTMLINGINNVDYPTVQGTVFVLSFFVCIINLSVDIAYAYADPRIKSQYENAGKRPSRKKEKELP